jgi:xanthine dehydrogenase/oxidase
LPVPLNQGIFFRGHSGNDQLNGYNIWAVNVTEVEIDILTGERNVLRSDIMEDTGATINPEVDIGQIEGGFVFSLGMWLQEVIKTDPDTGMRLTNDTWVTI